MSNQTTSSRHPNSFLARFGATILRGGIAAIPNALFRYQARLALKPQHVWFISTILSHQWDDSLPYPSLSKMAKQTGVSRRQLHNYQRQLVDLGLLEVINRHTETGGKTTNHYNFGPLFERLENILAEEQERPSASRHHENLSSHTHGNHSSHTHGNSSSRPYANTGSHLKKTQKEDSEKKDSESIESSKPRRDKSREKRETNQDRRQGASIPVGTTAPTVRALGQLLAERSIGRHADETSDRPELLDEDYQKIQDYIRDRAREFNDTATLKSSTTRAWRLYQRSGLSVDDFVTRIFQARSLTQEGTARITKTADDPRYGRQKTKMAYFFAVLEDQVGLRPKQRRRPRPPNTETASSRKNRRDEYRDVVQR